MPKHVIMKDGQTTASLAEDEIGLRLEISPAGSIALVAYEKDDVAPWYVLSIQGGKIRRTQYVSDQIGFVVGDDRRVELVED